jgi:hypothetical protein
VRRHDLEEETMGIKSKLTLAAGFVGAVTLAAAAFGQAGGTGASGSTPSAGSAPGQGRRAAATQQRQDRRCGRAGPRAARRVVHGELKVATRAGSFAGITIDSGEITSIDHAADKLTIKRADGNSLTATATDKTKVCIDGQASTFDALKIGDRARLAQVRSERFTGLRRIVAVTDKAQSSAGPNASPADFGGDLGGLPDGSA